MVEKNEISIGGSAFWILLSLIAVSTLVFLLIWSFHNNSVKGVVVGLIFISMIFASILFSRLKVFDMAGWGDNTLSMTAGFGIFALTGTIFGNQSVISVPQNFLFSTLASELPQMIEFTMNVFLIPIAEEMFWIVGLPFALFSVLRIFGKSINFFNNKVFQIFVVSTISSLSFAFFHVGKLFIAFIVSAIIFRTLMIVLVYAEHEFNILKGVNLVAGFAVGAHIANNMNSVGFTQSWLIIQSNFFPAGMIIIMIAIIFFGSGIERLISLLLRRKSATTGLFVKGD